MKRKRILSLSASASVLLALFAAACGPAAPATATTGPAPTATTGAVNPTATTAVLPTATKAVQATGTVGGTPAAQVSPSAGPKDKGAIQPVAVVATPAANPAAQKGGVLRRAVTSYPPDWTQWETTNAATSNASTPLHDWLVQPNNQEKGKEDVILPNLAYDWWLSNDGLQWTFKLVKGAKFTDATEMTCADVKFMLETIRDGQDNTGSQMRSSPRGQYVKRVKSVTCPDPYTVLIDTDAPLPSLVTSLSSGNFAIYSKAVFQGHIPNMMDKEGPAMGPFVISQRVAGDKVVYKRNTNYWNQPYPYLDGIEVQNLGSATAQYAAFRVGRAEIAAVPAGNQSTEIQRGFLNVQQGSHAGGYFMDINAQRQPWGDPRVRMALRCAIDNVTYVNTARPGDYTDMGAWPFVSKWGISPSELAAVDPCLNKDLTMAERRARGQQLMQQAGYGPNKHLSADMLIRSKTFVFDPLVTDLSTVYIDAKARILEVAAAYSAAYSGEFDIHPSGFITPNADPDQWLFEHYYSRSDRNYGKWSDPEVDALLDQQSRTIDPAKRMQMVKQIDTLIAKGTGKLIITQYNQPAFSAPWLMDWYFVEPSIASASEQFTRVWIDQAKLKAQGG